MNPYNNLSFFVGIATRFVTRLTNRVASGLLFRIRIRILIVTVQVYKEICLTVHSNK